MIGISIVDASAPVSMINMYVCLLYSLPLPFLVSLALSLFLTPTLTAQVGSYRLSEEAGGNGGHEGNAGAGKGDGDGDGETIA